MKALLNMDTLRYWEGERGELEALRDRVAELEEIVGLREKEPFLQRLPLTPQQVAILGVLYAAKGGVVVTRVHVYEIVFGMRQECEQPDPKIIDTVICKMRPRMMSNGVEIETVWGRGWLMTEQSKENLRKWVERIR
jgi:DNA-binding response OmpR family regulator